MGAGPNDAGPFVSPGDVDAAAKRLTGHVERTPSAESTVLSELLGCRVVLKFENLQFTAAFKERGALNRLLLLDDSQRAAGVVAMSAGNHAQAVARHAARLGIDAVIVMPKSTPFTKIHRTQALGARVVLAGDDLTGATAEARRIERDEHRVFIHPYDDPAVVAGQGTIALEMLDDHPDIDVFVVPAGGGGLLAGMAVAATSRRPSSSVVGVQTEQWPAVAETMAPAGRPSGGTTIAEGIAVAAPGQRNLEVIGEHVDRVLTVREETIEEAITLLIDIEKVVVEGAGAAGVAALLEHGDSFAGRTVGVVLTGGNIDPRLLSSVILRGLIRRGALSRIGVRLDDTPGNLGTVTALIGEAGGNIVEVSHNRMATGLPARVAEIEVLVDTFDHAHRDRIVAALNDAGYHTSVDESTDV